MTTTAAPTPVVSFENVHKSYGAVRAVSDLSLMLHPGETVALLGPNGAGKSSTLDLLLGLRPADSGSVKLFGTTPQAVAAGRVGAMLQSGGLMEEVKVRELVQLACALHPKPYPVADVLAQAGIGQIADRMVNKLSGGLVQKALALSCCLARRKAIFTPARSQAR
ncbi:ATP-binding cassette domain-containing protein [Streptomyces sp. NPDC048479]|uniref:ATP-binding cassette domain-containing protein n=1 Tax=Streptomyces sp. NPDC048479 TaxID=3154725 RepID=UPI00343E7CD1